MKALITLDFSAKTGTIVVDGQVNTTDGHQFIVTASAPDNTTNSTLLSSLKSQIVTQIQAQGLAVTAADVLLLGLPQ